MSKNILIVDDSESIREVVSFTLENEGYNVLIGVDGKDALKYLDGSPIDLIITDLHMPEMNGWEFLEQIPKRISNEFIPSIFMTTSSIDERDLDKSKNYPLIKKYIVKPFSLETVQETFNIEKN